MRKHGGEGGGGGENRDRRESYIKSVRIHIDDFSARNHGGGGVIVENRMISRREIIGLRLVSPVLE